MRKRLLVLFFLISVVAVACTGGKEIALPQRIAGLRLTEYVSGDEAIKAIARLHGKKISMKNGHIAHYRAGPHMVMVYISESYFDFLAGRLLDSMTANIRKGSKVFKNLKELRIVDTQVYSVTGQGQLHFYFKYGNMVFWVGADPRIARRAIEDIMVFLKTGRSGDRA